MVFIEGGSPPCKAVDLLRQGPDLLSRAILLVGVRAFEKRQPLQFSLDFGERKNGRIPEAMALT
jgi:hypothetical protein